MAAQILAGSTTAPRRASHSSLPAPAGRRCQAWIACLLMLGLCAAAEADQRGKRRGTAQRSTSSIRPPQQAAQPSIPRRLLPVAGLGSAANVPSNFYQRLNAPRPSHGGVPGGTVPQIIYVYPPTAYGVPYNSGPTLFESSSSPSRATEPATPVDVQAAPAQPHGQPIYVTRDELGQGTGSNAPRPVYLVEPPNQPPTAPAPTTAPPAAPAAPPVPKKASLVRFDIQPSDAEVYLDDEALGEGILLADAEDLILEPGVHVLEVSHPQFKTQRLVFGVGSGDPMEVVVDLAAKTPHRRSRIR